MSGTERRERRDEVVAGGQLRLITTEKRRPDWALDDKTREIGRAGVAAVRETLRRARPPEPGIRKAS